MSSFVFIEFKGMRFGQRMTAKQKAAVRESLEAVLSSIPDDRSCHTCSFEASGLCNRWSLEIPNDQAMLAGCDDWQDSGAPF